MICDSIYMKMELWEWKNDHQELGGIRKMKGNKSRNVAFDKTLKTDTTKSIFDHF